MDDKGGTKGSNNNRSRRVSWDGQLRGNDVIMKRAYIWRLCGRCHWVVAFDVGCVSIIKKWRVHIKYSNENGESSSCWWCSTRCILCGLQLRKIHIRIIIFDKTSEVEFLHTGIAAVSTLAPIILVKSLRRHAAYAAVLVALDVAGEQGLL